MLICLSKPNISIMQLCYYQIIYICPWFGLVDSINTFIDCKVLKYFQNFFKKSLKLGVRHKINFWICACVLWIHKRFFYSQKNCRCWYHSFLVYNYFKSGFKIFQTQAIYFDSLVVNHKMSPFIQPYSSLVLYLSFLGGTERAIICDNSQVIKVTICDLPS